MRRKVLISLAPRRPSCRPELLVTPGSRLVVAGQSRRRARDRWNGRSRGGGAASSERAVRRPSHDRPLHARCEPPLHRRHRDRQQPARRVVVHRVLRQQPLGVRDVGDDAIGASTSAQGSQGGDFFWNGTTDAADVSDGGTSDVAGAGTTPVKSVSFEIRHLAVLRRPQPRLPAPTARRSASTCSTQARAPAPYTPPLDNLGDAAPGPTSTVPGPRGLVGEHLDRRALDR